MAEILLSLTIIGVVAAITLPSLTGNINERTWNTQRKALYSRVSQAISLMPSMNGFGKYSGTNSDGVVTVSEDTAAETFVTDGLAKVLKINNICSNDKLADCGIVSQYIPMTGGSKLNWPTKLSELNPTFVETMSDSYNGSVRYWTNDLKDVDTKAVAFETANGESVAAYYNPRCQSLSSNYYHEKWHHSQPYMCANFIYDLNGSKGPNTMGKDIGFITVLYPTDPVVVAPMPLPKNIASVQIKRLGGECTNMDSESRGPNLQEINAIFYNYKFIGMDSLKSNGASVFLSSTSHAPSDKVWITDLNTGLMGVNDDYLVGPARCVKR